MHVDIKILNTLDDIIQNIDKPETELNNIIQNYLNSDFYTENIVSTIQWRFDNYEQLRKWAYPQMTEYNDAQVKINSGIPEMETEGQDQMNNYVQDCLAVKARFPKE